MTLENLDTVIAFVAVILLLSLVITTLVQMTSWFFKFRESTLLWGITRVLRQLAPPELSQDSISKLATQVANHESLQNRDSRPANAISFDEFVKVLQLIGESSSNEAGMAKVLAALRTAPLQEVNSLATALTAALSVAFPQQRVQVEDAVERVKAKALEAGNKLRFWFDTIMARTTERFTWNTRRVTVIAAIGVAVLARVDSVDILRQLAQKPDVRAKIVQMAMSDQTWKQASEILEPAATETRPPSTEARGGLSAANLAPLPGALKAIKLLHPEIPADFVGANSSDLAAWKQALAAKVPPELEERILAEFTAEYGKQELDRLLGQVKTLHGTLSQTALDLAPFSWRDYPKHIPGVLLSVFLLSLGAPFWFNTLRRLSNLRPLLARKVDEQTSQGDTP
jgi:hypothetical protein